MKGIAKHSAEFMDATGLKRWHTLELEFDQNSKHPLDALSEVETLVQQAVSKSSSQVMLDNSMPSHWTQPNANPYHVPTLQVNPGEREIGVKSEDILSSPDFKVLETYRWLIKSDKELERAYILRHDQLTALTTTES
jgi:hypothetical protein